MNEWLVDPALHIFPDTIRHDADEGGQGRQAWQGDGVTLAVSFGFYYLGFYWSAAGMGSVGWQMTALPCTTTDELRLKLSLLSHDATPREPFCLRHSIQCQWQCLLQLRRPGQRRALIPHHNPSHSLRIPISRLQHAPQKLPRR